MAIVDVYDALISERPYKPPLTHDTARHMILDGCGTHFDPLLICVFEKVSEAFQAIAQSYENEALRLSENRRD